MSERSVGDAYARFAQLVADLRVGCPWDAEQTHESLRRHLLEETYEVIEAIDALDAESGEGFDHLSEELGDLLFQVVFHATIAAEAAHFDVADVADGIHDKLHARHPHVFGDVEAADADQVAENWERQKVAEKGRESVMDGIPAALPALLLALKVQKKAVAVGVAVPADVPTGAVPPGTGTTEDAIGQLLFAVVDEARRHGVDPEAALRRTTRAFQQTVRASESKVRAVSEKD